MLRKMTALVTICASMAFVFLVTAYAEEGQPAQPDAAVVEQPAPAEAATATQSDSESAAAAEQQPAGADSSTEPPKTE